MNLWPQTIILSKRESVLLWSLISLVGCDLSKPSHQDRTSETYRPTRGYGIDQGMNVKPQQEVLADHLDMNLGVSLDMNALCMADSQRLNKVCGVDRCDQGTWERSVEVDEICNLHDDDCDGVVDEPSVSFSGSLCCDESGCERSAYCTHGVCKPLIEGACQVNADCPRGQVCEDSHCIISHEVISPSNPSSCEAPVNAELYSLRQREVNLVSGDRSARVMRAPNTIDCLQMSQAESSSSSRYEVTFSLSSINWSRWVNVESQVRVNDHLIPSALFISEECAPEAENVLLCVYSTTLTDEERTLRLEADRQHYVILSVDASVLEQALHDQLAQHHDVEYEVKLITSF